MLWSIESCQNKVQYCAKEMQTKFAEISEITRISVMKLRTFASDEKAAKFRCFYFSNVGEISQARWLIEMKFRGMRRHFVAKFRARWTKFRVIRTKFRFDEVKFQHIVHYCAITVNQIVQSILGLHVTSPKIKLGNYRFFWVSTFTRYYST